MKPFLRWRDDWLLGVDSLDNQHLAMAAHLNRIFTALEGGFGGSHLSRRGHALLLEFVGMTREHFQDEEALMQSSDYPGLIEHHREHLMLTAELHELIRQIEEGYRRFTLDTLTSLKYWQIDHVLGSDRDFADHLLRQEATAGELPSVSLGCVVPLRRGAQASSR